MNKEKEITRECKSHGLTTFILEGRGYHRCKKCRSGAVTRQRRRNKQKLLDHFGSKCCKCGYDKCNAALEFHHDDENKEFGIASKGVTISFKALLNEAEKCILVCANCHREIHHLLNNNNNNNNNKNE